MVQTVQPQQHTMHHGGDFMGNENVFARATLFLYRSALANLELQAEMRAIPKEDDTNAGDMRSSGSAAADRGHGAGTASA